MREECGKKFGRERDLAKKVSKEERIKMRVSLTGNERTSLDYLARSNKEAIADFGFSEGLRDVLTLRHQF